MIHVLQWPDQALAKISIRLIGYYQHLFSPDHSSLGKLEPFRGCKFYPSCSVYSVQILEKHGFVLGLPRILWRVLRCNPWSQGGVDKA